MNSSVLRTPQSLHPWLAIYSQKTLHSLRKLRLHDAIRKALFKCLANESKRVGCPVQQGGYTTYRATYSVDAGSNG